MTRPTTKASLLARTEAERAALRALVFGLPIDEVLAPGSLGEWSIKDTIAHLVAWDRLFVGWYEAGVRAESLALPAPGYTWREMDRLNDEIRETWRNEPWDQIRAAWDASSAALLATVTNVPEEALMMSGTWSWTGRGSLAGYAWACGSEHYHWARTEIESSMASRSVPA